MSQILRVAILDDHQSIIDGYRYRLEQTPDVKVVATAGYILKDDNEVIVRLAEVVKSVAAGDIFLSRQAEEQLHTRDTELPLTNRQTEVLSLLAADPDTTTAAIAHRLHLAHSTVRNLLSDAYLRLDVRNRSAAILKAQQLGLIQPTGNGSIPPE